jgi:hypothetical protein
VAERIDKLEKLLIVNKIALTLVSLIGFCHGGINAQNAPVSTAGSVSTFAVDMVVPITVTNFNNIGSCNLRLLYDPAIATANVVNKATGVGGILSYNVTTPGVISLGWFMYGGLSLPDNSEVFNIHFTKVASGTTVLSWDDSNGNYCTWSNANSIVLNDLPTEDYYISGLATFLSLNAPLTVAPFVKAYKGTSVDVPVTVSSFNSIGSFKLKLQYNSGSLIYQSFNNNSGFPGFTVNSSNPGLISVEGNSTIAGITLPDSAILFTLTFNYLGGFSPLNWLDDGTSCEYKSYPDQIVLNDLPTADYYINGSVTERISFQIKLFLEGPYTVGEMTTDLNTSGLIPLSQPFSELPWGYQGMEAVLSIPDSAVDWILIELRQTTGSASNATSDKSIGRKVGFLMKDGYVKDLSGGQNLDFAIIPGGNIYIVVFHRNHLPVISANPITIFNGFGFYDFSLGASQAFGGVSAHKELSLNVWGMRGGDADGNRKIEYFDKNEFWIFFAGYSDYYKSDFNLDGQVCNEDKNNIWLSNLGFESQIPE